MIATSHLIYDPQHAMRGMEAFWRCRACRCEFGYGGQVGHLTGCESRSNDTQDGTFDFVVGDAFIFETMRIGRVEGAPVDAGDIAQRLPDILAELCR